MSRNQADLRNAGDGSARQLSGVAWVTSDDHAALPAEPAHQGARDGAARVSMLVCAIFTAFPACSSGKASSARRSRRRSDLRTIMNEATVATLATAYPAMVIVLPTLDAALPSV